MNVTMRLPLRLSLLGLALLLAPPPLNAAEPGDGGGAGIVDPCCDGTLVGSHVFPDVDHYDPRGIDVRTDDADGPLLNDGHVWVTVGETLRLFVEAEDRDACVLGGPDEPHLVQGFDAIRLKVTSTDPSGGETRLVIAPESPFPFIPSAAGTYTIQFDPYDPDARYVDGECRNVGDAATPTTLTVHAFAPTLVGPDELERGKEASYRLDLGHDSLPEPPGLWTRWTSDRTEVTGPEAAREWRGDLCVDTTVTLEFGFECPTTFRAFEFGPMEQATTIIARDVAGWNLNIVPGPRRYPFSTYEPQRGVEIAEVYRDLGIALRDDERLALIRGHVNQFKLASDPCLPERADGWATIGFVPDMSDTREEASSWDEQEAAWTNVMSSETYTVLGYTMLLPFADSVGWYAEYASTSVQPRECDLDGPNAGWAFVAVAPPYDLSVDENGSRHVTNPRALHARYMSAEEMEQLAKEIEIHERAQRTVWTTLVTEYLPERFGSSWREDHDPLRSLEVIAVRGDGPDVRRESAITLRDSWIGTWTRIVQTGDVSFFELHQPIKWPELNDGESYGESSTRRSSMLKCSP